MLASLRPPPSPCPRRGGPGARALLPARLLYSKECIDVRICLSRFTRWYVLPSTLDMAPRLPAPIELARAG